MYASPNCIFCNKDTAEDTIHIIRECPAWIEHCKARDVEIRAFATELQIDLPPDMFLKSSDDYAPARISSAHYTWPLAKKMWGSTGKLPHKSISEMNTFLPQNKLAWAYRQRECGGA